jgi:hypothetical protein
MHNNTKHNVLHYKNRWDVDVAAVAGTSQSNSWVALKLSLPEIWSLRCRLSSVCNAQGMSLCKKVTQSAKFQTQPCMRTSDRTLMHSLHNAKISRSYPITTRESSHDPIYNIWQLLEVEFSDVLARLWNRSFRNSRFWPSFGSILRLV